MSGPDAGVPHVVPPPALRDRVLAVGTPSPMTFLRATQGFWLETSDGVQSRILFRDSRDRYQTRQLALRAGARLPAPELAGHVAVHVLAGALRGPGAQRLAAGDSAGGLEGEWRADAATRVIEFATAGTEALPPSLAPQVGATWLPLADGIRVRCDPVGMPGGILLFDAVAGATLAEHVHDGIEELLVVSGSCVVEGEELSAGDYHRAAADSTHGPTVAGTDGCRLLCVHRAPAGGSL
ncbi:MAG: cupin domain-containing protein [Gemmatimonadetes bacterium]|nr:cupin domain-containing protein [Gemmatimonadota bacterium]